MNLTVTLGDTRCTVEWHPDWHVPQMGELLTLDEIEGFVAIVHTTKRENYVPTVEIALRPVASMSTMEKP